MSGHNLTAELSQFIKKNMIKFQEQDQIRLKIKD
jgi:hypothetical protein